MRASGVPTGTVSSSATSSSATRPVAGEGTSVSILSVDISQMISSFCTQSPARLCHTATQPSATDTPICGIDTGTSGSARSVFEELTTGLLDLLDLRQQGALERRRERDRHVGGGDAHDGAVEVLERMLGDQRGHLCPGRAALLRSAR